MYPDERTDLESIEEMSHVVRDRGFKKREHFTRNQGGSNRSGVYYGRMIEWKYWWCDGSRNRN